MYYMGEENKELGVEIMELKECKGNLMRVLKERREVLEEYKPEVVGKARK